MTVDGGATWTAAATTVTQSVYGLANSGANHIFAVGQGGMFIASTDGGAAWQELFAPTGRDLWGIYFFDTENGQVVGFSEAILMTLSGGL